MVELVHTISQRIAMGPQQGQKVFTLQTLPAINEGEYGQLATNSNLREQLTATQRRKNNPRLINKENEQSDN